LPSTYMPEVLSMPSVTTGLALVNAVFKNLKCNR
jgi:hypothetical protein